MNKNKLSLILHGLNLYDYGARLYDPLVGQFTSMDPLCEKYYSVSPYAYCAGNPVNRIDVDGDSIRVYTETTSFGHSWLSVGEGNDMVVYTYGRYNGTYKGANDKYFFNSLANGDGCLLRLHGKEAEDYFSIKAKNNYKVFTIKDIDDKDVSSIIDNIFFSSNRSIKNSSEPYINSNNSRIIDDYNLLSNNCTTFVCDVLNQAGSKILESSKSYQTSAWSIFYNTKVFERFVLPCSLQYHLSHFMK